jgi:predicted nucleic acid-binding Zn ribbon protein
MADTTPPPLEPIANKDALEKIIEKDERSTRTPTGLWHWVTALLAGGMVLFYFYAAGVASVGTQYHRGVYVFIT